MIKTLIKKFWIGEKKHVKIRKPLVCSMCVVCECAI